MIKKVEMFTIICDNCGKDGLEDSDFAAYNDKDIVKEMVHEEDWQEIEGKDYCPDCYVENTTTGEMSVIKTKKQ